MQNEDFGCSVSNAGDFNGDGLQDIIIGACSANFRRGAAFVVFGTRQNPSVIDMYFLNSSMGVYVTSNAPSLIGEYLGGGRDINGDGKSDIIIGDSKYNQKNNNGSVYVIYGYNASSNASSSGKILLENLQPSQGFAMIGPQEYSRFGECVAMLKDVNGDGLDDFFVGAKGPNGGKGSAYVFYLPWKCSDKCSTCSKPEKCDTCAQGFVSLHGDCISCPQTTHFLSNGECIVRCSSNCKHCSAPNTCETCAQGFGLLNNHCVLCDGYTHILNNGICVERTPENCEIWSKPDSCDICHQGFGLVHNKCEICPEETHFLHNGVCNVKCSANCAGCSRPHSCDTCISSFGFHNGNCITCDPATHILKNGICVDKHPQNCAIWAPSEICYKCQQGFGFLGGNCVSCPSETHILSNGFCKMKCTENCAQCTQINECDFCAEGFGFLNHTCVVCPKNHFLENGFCIEDHDAWQNIKDFFGGLFHKV